MIASVLRRISRELFGDELIYVFSAIQGKQV
jgi:hypothetical protein